jgi:hypothetical protein
LLAELDCPSPLPTSPVAEALSDKWSGINSVENPQFVPFLEDLFDLDRRQEPAITRLCGQVIEQLSVWIQSIDDESWLRDLVKPVQQHPKFEHDLDGVLEAWWEAKFTERYETVATNVANALQKWAVDEAWQMVSSLDNPSLPVSLRNQVTQLQQIIGTVKDDMRHLETLLNEISDNSCHDWFQVQRLTIHRCELQPFKVKSNYAPPAFWQNKIEATLPALSARIQIFIATQAQACRDLPAVREFYREFQRLGFNETDNLEISWFESIQTTYQTDNNNELQACPSINELTQIRQRIYDDKMSLPVVLAQWLQHRADAVDILIKQWQQMIKGLESKALAEPLESKALALAEPLESKALALAEPPKAFKRDIPKYQSLWQQLLDIEQSLDTKNPLTDSDFQEAKDALEQILAKYPNHQYAQDLLSEIETKHQQHRFVQALQQWDIEAFLQHCDTVSPTEIVQPYLQLVEYKDALKKINNLYQANQFSNSQAAAAWWQDWYDTVTQLPELPAEFSGQLEIIALERRRAWFKILKTLLENPKVAASVCHEAVDTLEKWQADSAHFLRYYQDLKRRAWYQETTECLAAKNWIGAKNAIAQFENAGGDKTKLEGLKVLLAIRQAQADSLSKLADVLLEQWFLLKLYLPEQLGKLLYQAIANVWQNNDRARLAKLKDLASTIPDTKQPKLVSSQKVWVNLPKPDRFWKPVRFFPHNLEKIPKLLGLCRKWLDIEHALTMPEVTPSTLLEFAKLVFVKNGHGIRYMLRQPVNRLIAQWQNDNDLLFAWIYIAAQRVQPPLIHEAAEPLTQLTGQSQQAAARVRKHLAQLLDISNTDLANAQTTLKSERDNWQRLKDFINLLPFSPAQQVVIPNSLDKVNKLVNELKRIKQYLIYLEDADLREEPAQSKLINVQGFVRDQLPNFLVREVWLNRVEVLEPLTRLTFILKQFGKTARRFGSNDLKDLEQRDLLVRMERFLLKLIEKFEHANLVERGFWQILSQECWTLVCQEGGVLNPKIPDKPDLRTLRDLLLALDEEEKQFRITLIKLYDEAWLTHVPSGAKIDASDERYQAFFTTIPKEPPRTRRGYWLFKRETDKEPMATLLKSAQGQLPTWVNQFLEHGIP